MSRRGLALAAVAALATALASLLLARWLPLPMSDAFRSTLVVLPAVAVALMAIGRWGRAEGARRLLPLGPATPQIEATALLALAVLAVSRRSLGLSGLDAVVAGGFLLLLAHHVARTVAGWAPRVPRDGDRRPTALFFALPFVVYLALLPWSSEHRPPDGDEPYYLLVTHSLVEDRDADLRDDYAAGASRVFVGRALEPQPGDPTSRDGGIYSRHNLLLPLALAPAFAIAGRWGALVTMAALAALLAWLVLRLLVRLHPGRPTANLLAWATVAFAPPLLVYSYQVWIEVPAAILVAVALERLARPAERPWTRRDLAVVAGTIALLPLLKLRLGLVAAPLALLALWRATKENGGADRRRVALATLVALAGASGLLVAHNQWRFGNPLKVHSVGELEILEKPFSAFARGLFGPFFDVAFGLFFASPVWWLAIPGVVLLWRRRRRWLVIGAILTAPYLLALAPRTEWYGGWSPPFRYLLLFLPLLEVALVPAIALRRTPAVRILATALVVATVVLTAFWVAIPGWTFNFADGQSLLAARVADRLAADIGRFLPSYVRPGLASWLWPLAALVLALPAVLRRSSPGRRTATAGLAGFVLVLVLLVALPVAASRLPTTRVEAEDGQVVKSGGMPHPSLWIPQRARYRSGWLLTGGSRLTAPVVAGGERVTLRVTARFLTRRREPYSLRLTAGTRELATWEGTHQPDGWRTLTVGPVEWPAGARLVLAAPFSGGRGGNVVAVDRVELVWHGGETGSGGGGSG